MATANCSLLLPGSRSSHVCTAVPPGTYTIVAMPSPFLWQLKMAETFRLNPLHAAFVCRKKIKRRPGKSDLPPAHESCMPGQLQQSIPVGRVGVGFAACQLCSVDGDKALAARWHMVRRERCVVVRHHLLDGATQLHWLATQRTSKALHVHTVLGSMLAHW
eukprot:366036-Chlamydomonas_euryale.AAC.12